MSIRYGCVPGTGTSPCLEYPCFRVEDLTIAGNCCLSLFLWKMEFPLLGPYQRWKFLAQVGYCIMYEYDKHPHVLLNHGICNGYGLTGSYEIVKT